MHCGGRQGKSPYLICIFAFSAAHKHSKDTNTTASCLSILRQYAHELDVCIKGNLLESCLSMSKLNILCCNYLIATVFKVRDLLVGVKLHTIVGKIILLGITSKVCSAETSGNTDRTVTREDETKPPLLSAKRARLTVGSSGRLVSLMTVPLLPLWGAGGRGGILSGYGTKTIFTQLAFHLSPCPPTYQ